MVYKAVMFDLDETLVYTPAEYRQDTIERIGAKLGVEIPTGFADRFWFRGNRAPFVRKSLGLDDLSGWWRAYVEEDTAEARQACTLAFDDVSVIRKIKEAGYKTGTVTGAPPWVSAVNLSILGEELFDANVVANQRFVGIKQKPDPEGLLICLDQLEIHPHEAMYIGNGDEDVLAAQRAGVLDILIDRGHYPPPTNVNPSMTITSLHGLRPLLRY